MFKSINNIILVRKSVVSVRISFHYGTVFFTKIVFGKVFLLFHCLFLSSFLKGCEDETQGPDGTATQAPDNTPDITPDKSPDNTPDNTPDSTPDKGSKDKKYRYVKQYCVASEEDVTFNDCGQKAPSFGVKMPEFLEKYKTEL